MIHALRWSRGSSRPGDGERSFASFTTSSASAPRALLELLTFRKWKRAVLLLPPRAQYERCWAQYVAGDGAFEQVDSPASVLVARAPKPSRGNR